MSVTDYFFPLTYVSSPEKAPFFNPASWMGLNLKKLDDIERSSYLVSQTRLVALNLLILADRLFIGFPKALGKISLVGLNGVGLACLPSKPSKVYKTTLDMVLAFRRREVQEFFYSLIKVINTVSDCFLMMGACTASTLSLFSFSANAWKIYSVVNPFAAFSVVLWGIGYFGDLYIKLSLDKDLKNFAIDIALRNIIESLISDFKFSNTTIKDWNELGRIYTQIDVVSKPDHFFDQMEVAGKDLITYLDNLKKDPQLLKKHAFIERKKEECEVIFGRITSIKNNSDPQNYTHNWTKVAEIFCNYYENPLINIDNTEEGNLAARTIYQLEDYDLAGMRQKFHSLNEELQKKYPTVKDRESDQYKIEKHALLKEIYASTVIKISSTLTHMAIDLTIRVAGSVGLIVRKFFPLTAFEIAIDTFFAMLYWGRNYITYLDKQKDKDNIASVRS